MTFLLQQVIRKRNDFLLVEIGMYDVTNERERERKFRKYRDQYVR